MQSFDHAMLACLSKTVSFKSPRSSQMHWAGRNTFLNKNPLLWRNGRKVYLLKVDFKAYLHNFKFSWEWEVGLTENRTLRCVPCS